MRIIVGIMGTINSTAVPTGVPDAGGFGAADAAMVDISGAGAQQQQQQQQQQQPAQAVATTGTNTDAMTRDDAIAEIQRLLQELENARTATAAGTAATTTAATTQSPAHVANARSGKHLTSRFGDKCCPDKYKVWCGYFDSGQNLKMHDSCEGCPNGVHTEEKFLQQCKDAKKRNEGLHAKKSDKVTARLQQNALAFSVFYGALSAGVVLLCAVKLAG